MYAVATSGQILGFPLISAFSGTALTGLSGLISGYKSIDNGSQVGISGLILEKAFGQYVAILNDFDTSGRIISYYFTAASGAIPVEKTVVTTLNVSGDIYPSSGHYVVVPIASISGVVANSGLYVTVLPANLSGVVANSGLFVNATANVGSGTLYLASGSIFLNTFASGVVGGGSGNLPSAWGNSGAVTVGQNLDKTGYGITSLGSGILSGQQVTLVSGQSYVASGITVSVPISSISGAFANSGLFVTVPIATISGTNVVVPLSTLSGIQPISGTTVSVPISSISGVTVATASGTLYLASGSITSGVINSGIFVTATASVQSGQVYLASGQVVSLNSGQSVLVYSGQLSGQPIAGLSGFIYPASGVFVNATATVNSGLYVTVPISSISGVNAVVPLASLSGVVANSGLYATVPSATLSGVNSIVPLASLSGLTANSGLFVTVPIASISGVQIASGTLSGQTLTAISSGAVATILSGVITLNSADPIFSSGITLEDAVGQIFQATIGTAGTCFDTAATKTAFNTTLAQVSGFWNEQLLVFTAGGLVGQARSITTYVDTNGRMTFDEGWTAAPHSGDTFTILHAHIHPISEITSGVWCASLSGTSSGAAGDYLNDLATSGVKLFSGQSVVVPLSVISGVNAVVPPTSLSGVTVNSGLFVTVPITTISGTNAVVPIATLSGVTTASGASVTVPLASISGVNSVVPPASLSGVFTTAALQSGQSVLVYSGQLSGQPIAGLSGFIYPASGINVTATATVQSGQVYLASGTPLFYSGLFYIASGPNVNATATVQSGQVYLASGSFLFGSGQFFVGSGSVTATANSGLFVTVPITTISGVNAVVPVSTLSGIQPISGTFVSVPTSSLSGITANSGLFVNVPITTISGTNAVVPIATLSGIQSASGVNVVVPVANLSGVNAIVPVSTLSGIQPISGTSVVTTISTASLSGVNAIVPLASLSGIQIASGGMSGQPVYPVSGQVFVGSGSVTATAGSGIYAVVPISSISGVNAVVPTATLSGVQPASGTYVTVPGATLSGSLYLAPSSLTSGTFTSGLLTKDLPASILTRDTSGLPSTPIHSLVNANRKMTDKWDTTTNSGFLTVFLEDGITQAYTQALTSQSGAPPVVSLGDA